MAAGTTNNNNKNNNTTTKTTEATATTEIISEIRRQPKMQQQQQQHIKTEQQQQQIMRIRSRQHHQQQPEQPQQQQHRKLLLFGVSVLIGILVFGPIGSNAMPVTGGDAHSVEFKRYCSNTLSDAIRLICGGRYYSLSRKFPESVGHGPVRSLQSVATADDDTYYRPLVSGPIHECCRRPCGYSQLKLYCATED